MRRASRLSRCAIAAIAVASANAAYAATYYWTGDVSGAWDANSGGNTNWSTDGTNNVDSGILPTDGDDLVFAQNPVNLNTTVSTGAIVSTVHSTSLFNSITVLSNTSSLVIGGDAVVGINSTFLRLGAGGLTIQAGAGPVTVTARQGLAVSQTYTNNSSNTMVMQGIINGQITGGVLPTITLAAGKFRSTTTLSDLFLRVETGATYIVGSSPSINLQGGTIDGNAAGVVLGALAGTGGTFQNFLVSNPGLNLDLTSIATTTTFSGVISSTVSALNVRGNASGTMSTQVLTGVNAYTAGTSIATVTGRSATLQLDGGDGRLPSGTALSFGAANPAAATNGKLILGGSISAVKQTISSIAITASNNAPNNAFIVGGNSAVSTLIVNNSAARSFAGTLGGAGANENNLAIVKSGVGALTLTGGGNTYSGGTVINGGRLLANGAGATGTGGVTVQSGGTLAGTASVGGTVEVNSGGIVLGGDGSTGTALTINNNLNLLDGSVVSLTLGTGGSHSALSRGGGAWTFDNDQAFQFLGTGVTSGSSFDNVITGLAGDPGTEASWTIANGWVGTFTYDGGGNIDLAVISVPEPASGGLLLLAAGALGVRRRRRR